ncbi:MAG: GntR family transcriptional regulator [Candidatus Cyclobacteriaceae bacterium M3_2C_046]
MQINERLPQYKKLYELLRRQIENGLYQEGSLLPSENELCQVHQVTRPTVRQALDRLVNEGYIHKHQGKGSIVNPLPQGIGILSLQGTTSGIGHKKLKTHILEKPQVKSWPNPFFFPLTGEIQDMGCIELKRQRIIEDKVILFEITYLPNWNLPRFSSRSFENKSLFDLLRIHYQIEIKGGEQKLWAIPADTNISKNLHVKKDKPILHLQRRMETNRSGMSIYSSIYCNTEHYFLYGVF